VTIDGILALAMLRRTLLLLIVLAGSTRALAAQTVAAPLPPWQPGNLDIHIINTGRGDAALLILPDGTSLQFDAGDGGAPVGSPSYSSTCPMSCRCWRRTLDCASWFGRA
jgi:hypothetical protein